MKQFLRHIFLLVAMLVATANAWAEWPEYKGTIKNVSGRYYVVYDEAEDQLSASGSGESKDYNFGGPGENISFQAMRSRVEAIGNLTVTEYTDNTSLSELYKDNPEAAKYSWGTAKEYKDPFGPYSLNRSANRIVFKAGPIGSYVKKIQNIKVPMLSYMAKTNLPSWTADPAMIGAADETTTIKLDWSNTSALTYEIKGDGASQFSCAITNNASAGKYGTATITITYKHKEVNTHTATLELSNGEKIELSGTTLPKETVFTWNLVTEYLVGDEGELIYSYELKDALGGNITEQLHKYVTFSSSNDKVVAIDMGKGTFIAVGEGTATITATFKGEEGWQPFTKTLDIIISKRTAILSWPYANTGSNTGTYFVGDYVALSEFYKLIDEVTREDVSRMVSFKIETIERSAIYKADGDNDYNNDVVSIENGKIIAKNAGKAKLIASVEGGDVYNSFVSEFTLTIDKHTPVFYWNSNVLPYYLNTTIVNIAFSTNRDANYPLEFKTSDETIAEVVNGDLKIYGKGQAVSITVSQAENAEYKKHEESFTFTPCQRPNFAVPFRVSKERHLTSVQIGSKCDWVDDSVIQLSYPSILDGGFVWEDDQKRIVVTFGGVPDKLYFDYHASTGSTAQSLSYSWKVEESVNGTDWTEVWRTSHLDTEWAASGAIDLKASTQYIRLSYTGNLAGYIKNITVSSLEGNSYLRAADGTYLSRGYKYGTQASVDPFGVVCRVSNFTEDNVNIYSRFQFVDNMQYLYETHDTEEMFTDDQTALNSANKWVIQSNASGEFTMQSGNDLGNKGRYVTIKNNVLTFTDYPSEATIWQMEAPVEHDLVLKEYMDAVAAWAASKDFGSDVKTLDDMRRYIDVQDFEKIDIALPTVTLSQHEGEYRDGINGTLSAYDNTISGLEPGIYRLTVKAFYRISESEIAQKARNNDFESVLAYVYANDVKYPIQSVYDSYNASQYDGSDKLYDNHYYPTLLQPSAEQAFNESHRYLNDVYVYVEADADQSTGTLRYGIKNPSYVPGAWLAYRDFTLTYIGRKDYIFVGTDSSNPKDWNNASNWNRGVVPSDCHNVTIKADIDIISPTSIYGITIDENKTIHIQSTGGLTIGKEGIRGAKEGSIIIDNAPQGAGFLRVDPTTDNKPANVTVNYTTRTYDNGSPRNEVWQYLGMPGANGQISSLEGVSMYHWKETSGWIQKSAADLQNIPAWDGYAFTQSKEEDATFKISVEPILENKEIHFTCTPKGMKGDNLFVNSYLAPIDVTKIDEDDIVDSQNNLVRTFFIFNSGSWNDWNAGAGDITAGDYDKSSPGHYYSIPFFSAKLINDGTTQVVIPSMQGVYVYSAGASSIKLDYNKHVLGANAKDMHKPMRAPQYQMEDEFFRRVRIQASSENSGADRMYIVQEKNTTPEYDNGYDGDNIIATGQVNIYTHEPFGQMEVSCSNHIDSMLIGFTAGEDSIYTLTFGAVVGEDMYLLDLQTDSLMHLSDGQQYSFSAQPNSVDDMRFRLVVIPNSSDNEQPNEGDVTTNVDNVSDTTCLWVKDNIVYVMDAPYNSSLSVYSVSGICIQAPYIIHQAPCTIDLSHLPTGVYVLKLNDKAFKIVCD